MRSTQPTRFSASLKAFTLIELLVVIVILGILMAVAVPTFLRQQQKAQDSKTQQQLSIAYRAVKTDVPDAGGNQYPPLNTLVTDLRQSEPELTVSQGNCSQSANDKQIVVDSTISAPSKVYLYAKSASGSVWSLSSPAASAPVFRQLYSCAGALVLSSLTAFTNVATDASRANGAVADGLANDSSFGIWPTTTNLITNGGFESNLGGWSNDAGTTFSRDPTVSKLGGASAKLVTSSTGDHWIQLLAINGSLIAGNTYTLSFWVKASIPGLVTTRMIGVQAGVGNTFDTGGTYNTVANSWQRLTLTLTMPASTNQLYGRVCICGGAGTASIDGVQLEQSNIASPYIETSSGTVTRPGSSVTYPTSQLNTTQGWIALRLRPEWASASAGLISSGTPGVFEWQDNATTRIGDYYDGATHSFRCFRQNSGGSSTGGTTNFSQGQTVTVICKWDATTIGESVDGGSFQATANATIPTLASNTLSIGTILAGQRQWSGEVLWAAGGTGALNDSDAGTINGFGDIDPTPQQFPTSAQAKFVWTADDGTVLTQ